MPDRRAPSEASHLPPHYRSSHLEGPQYHFDSTTEETQVQEAPSSQRRRRPSRAKSSTHDPSRPEPVASIDTNERWFRGPRNILKKPARRDSHTEPRDLPQIEHHERNDTLGFKPKLGQIREGRVDPHLRSQARSTVSSTSDPRALRRRHTDDHVLRRSRADHKHGLHPRRAESFTALSNPSLDSVMTGTTRESAASAGTTTTVTQQAWDEQKRHNRQAQPRQSRTDVDQPEAGPSAKQTDPPKPGVFQFLQEDSAQEHLPIARASSSESSSASDQEEEEEEDAQHSSDLDGSHEADSPTTSPASTRRSDSAQFQKHEFPHLKKPLYASSFVHGHGGEEHAAEEDTVEEESEVDEGSNTESESESEDEHDGLSIVDMDAEPTPPHTQRRPTPPRSISTSSPHSDKRGKRLKQQERELANHILKSPKPRKQFKFTAAPQPPTHPTMPLYSSQPYTGQPPMSPQAAAVSMHAWPPMASFPPPLPIGNAPHQSPELKQAYPLAVQPPMGPPGMPAPHSIPPFSPSAVHSSLYQQHTSSTRSTIVGYELLAGKLSEPSLEDNKSAKKTVLIPMYRKFEHLNHRVMLHLQDEMSELEEELRQLDECIVQSSPRDEAGHIYPASRRGDARFGGELHFKRTELLGRIFQKTGQYNQALTSFNDLVKSFDPASTQNIRAYRTWMHEHSPIDEVESRFLDHDDDLVTVSPRRSSSIVSTISPAQHPSHLPIVTWFLLVLTAPLMAYAIVPSLLGRLLVLALTGAVELKLVTSAPELINFIGVQQWTMIASVYFGLMVVLASFV